jgi:hypothetical protein
MAAVPTPLTRQRPQARGIEVVRGRGCQRRRRGRAGAGVAAGLRQVGAAASMRTHACRPLGQGHAQERGARPAAPSPWWAWARSACALRSMAQAMDMRVHRPSTRIARNLPDCVQAADLDTVWRESRRDFAALPADRRQPQPAGRCDTLSRCKRGVIVVNTARGGLIEEAALLAAVHSRARCVHGRAGQFCGGAHGRRHTRSSNQSRVHFEPAHWWRDAATLI